MDAALKLTGVSRQFGGITAVSNVHLDLEPGERCALLGPNGAGKTTLFNLIAGDIPPSSGRIELFGEDITRHPVAARVWRGLRRTYQKSALFDNLSVAENLFLGALGPGGRGHLTVGRSLRSARARWAQVEHTADMVGLSGHLTTTAAALSHGERRQLEIGLALGEDARMILLDEPAAGLSPEERATLTGLLSGLSRDCSLVMIEHDMDMALALTERVVVLSDGALVAEGTPEQIVDDPLVREVYLGGGGEAA
ncbi:Lipopolysaccharide export system ATP-binding protein LptB [wastewater metagenome]|uniref:Lipopolysaccharide export system ATP-binding protein LptB n=2 Tax=unclassified sequences TaxID=12908 RepID=A0A5B8RDS7_9ZZZZ|nr:MULTISPECIES: ABC transporter ATP-binding protein [Arhodomonas]MCS4505855.1 ABC transporter ATP-binding protein [Arhodomonas aquaeolei]QEA07189.1 lipopolysaccharide export system ATP-binding protein LptB [uncultured organism]